MSYKDPAEQIRWRSEHPTYDSDRYQQDRSTFLQKHHDRKAALREWLNTYKTSKPCLDCGVLFHFSMMQFDHRPTEKKFMDVTNMVGRGFGLTRIQQEIDKCDLVCANCHAYRTWKRLREKV